MMNPWITDASDLVSDFETFLKSNKDISAFLWLSVSGESRETQNHQKILSLLQQHAPQKLTWKSAQFDQYVSALSSALVSVFADRYLASDSPVISAGVQSIKSYYQQLSENKYGYAISSENAMRALGIAMFNKEQVKKAIEVFQINIKDYPDSPHVYAVMANVLTQDGDLTEALAMRKIASELATKQNNAYDSYYKQLYTDLKSKLSAK